MATTPHIDTRWSTDFVLALRERNVPGTDIGDALAHVESFCADSGESASDAFGDPAEYAASLAFAPVADEPLLTTRQLAAALLGMATFLVLPDAVVAWTHGERVEIGATDLAILAVMAGIFVALVRNLDAFLRMSLRWSVVVGTVPLLASVALALLVAKAFPGASLTLPAPPLALGSAAVLVVPAVVQIARGREPSADLVVDPFEDAESVRHRNRRWGAATAWALPLCAVVATALVYGLDALGRA